MLSKEEQLKLMGMVQQATEVIKKLTAERDAATNVINLQNDMLGHSNILITRLAKFIKENNLESQVEIPEKYYGPN